MVAKIDVLGEVKPEYEQILTPEALNFVGKLTREFSQKRQQLLEDRVETQVQINLGRFPDFLTETRHIRESDWEIAPVLADLHDRRVEITGPVDRKMIINGLNSGANVFMADFEDSHSPTWKGTIEGQINLRDAVRKTIAFKSPEGKDYKLNERTATLLVRPRGWHLEEKHVLVDNKPVPAGMFDFALFFYHNAQALLDQGTAPYFYLPKIESHREARLWNELFKMAQDELSIPRATIKATVLIETILAAFEMDEILYELRDHSAGLNCGRWDYIFSVIKKFKVHHAFVLPDRAQVTMETHFLKSYVDLLIQTCHKRGAHAMGGMAAQIPIKNDPEENEAALEKVRKDKLREVLAGHDGTWVAHPGLVAIAKRVFDQYMPTANQLYKERPEVNITKQDLLTVPQGDITEQGLRTNIRVGVQYLESWLRGVGCVPLYTLMEDAATAEISRSQIWQWIRHKSSLADGRRVSKELFNQMLDEEFSNRSAQGKYALATKLFRDVITEDVFPDFLTIPAYEHIIETKR